jgi:hypothetical protein
MLSVLQVLPHLWTKKKFKQIPESISAIQSQPDLFPPIAGDSVTNALDGSAFDDDRTTLSLTKDYVNRLANHQSVGEQSPIFQVILHKKNFEESMSNVQ